MPRNTVAVSCRAKCKYNGTWKLYDGESEAFCCSLIRFISEWCISYKAVSFGLMGMNWKRGCIVFVFLRVWEQLSYCVCISWCACHCKNILKRCLFQWLISLTKFQLLWGLDTNGFAPPKKQAPGLTVIWICHLSHSPFASFQLVQKVFCSSMCKSLFPLTSLLLVCSVWRSCTWNWMLQTSVQKSKPLHELNTKI